jgi:hypothetical protein
MIPPLLSNFVVPQPSPNPNLMVPQPSPNPNLMVSQPSPNPNLMVPQPSPNPNLMVPQPSPNPNLIVPQHSSTSSQLQRPCVTLPFWLVFIFGNVSRCKGRISRGEDKKLLPPPDDIVFGHKEYVIYQNSKSGNFEQSRKKRNVYYHPLA